MSVIKTYEMRCDSCGFVSHDQALMDRHSCDVQQHNGHCEDWPSCGHEWGDCNGLLYGSDEAIKQYAELHVYCDHEAGIFCCEDDEDEGDEE